MNTLDETIGTRISERINKLDLSIEYISKYCQVNEMTVTAWMNNDEEPHGNQLYKLAKVLQTNPGFFNDEDLDNNTIETKYIVNTTLQE